MSADPPGYTAQVLALRRALAGIPPEETAIAATPKDEVARSGKARLYRYRPTREPRTGPLLILHGLVGRQSVADLEPRRSLVRRMLDAGVDTWVADWGNPTRADRCLDFSDYDELIGEFAETIAAQSDGRRPALLGICQGGVFALCHAALHPGSISGLGLAITPVDFHACGEDGTLNLWLRSLSPELVERWVDECGNLPGRMTGAVFQALTPARTLAKYTTGLLAMAENRDALLTFLRMERWLADRPDLPGATAKQWLIGLYHRNELAEGRFQVGGRTVRLADIACPVLNIFGTQDHIVPPACSRALRGLLADGHDYQEVAAPTGHVGVFVSRNAAEIVPPALTGWLARIG